MIRSGRELRGTITYDADAVVVGTGAGGGMALRELARAGLRVVALEEGGFRTPADFDQREDHMLPELFQDGGARTTKDLAGQAIAQQLQREFGAIEDAYIAIFPPPPVQGLGTIGGFKLYVEDRGDNGLDALYGATQGLIGKAYQTPGLTGLFSSYTINTPQLQADVDRAKAKAQGVPLANVFETMQINLGSLYVNDFNRFGRTYQVVAQADAQFRDRPDDILRLVARNGGVIMVNFYSGFIMAQAATEQAEARKRLRVVSLADAFRDGSR